MKSQTITAALVAVLLLSGVPSFRAFETDQYDLPPEPLVDIGDEVSQHIEESILVALKNVNTEIELHESCLRASMMGRARCEGVDKEKALLAELREPDTVAHAVYKLMGDGDLFTTAAGKWFGKHKFAHEPSRYKPTYSDSIFLTRPINYATLSPTVRIYGAEFGFDKIDHFFQQGYKYYRKYNEAIAKGMTPEAATRDAVAWGQMTERTYFGTLVSGVYSNGDLFANYAGMKFYQRLTHDTVVNGRMLPALVIQRDGRWIRNSDEKGTLQPFIADNLNEALNPSGYSFLLYKVVKKIVRDRSCKRWRELYPNATAAEFEKRTAALETWNGEDYGFTRKSKTVPIAVCFENTLSGE